MEIESHGGRDFATRLNTGNIPQTFSRVGVSKSRPPNAYGGTTALMGDIANDDTAMISIENCHGGQDDDDGAEQPNRDSGQTGRKEASRRHRTKTRSRNNQDQHQS